VCKFAVREVLRIEQGPTREGVAGGMVNELRIVVATSRSRVEALMAEVPRLSDDAAVSATLPLDTHVIGLASEVLASASVAVVDASADPSEALGACEEMRRRQPTLPIGALFCCSHSATPAYLRALLTAGVGGFWDLNLSAEDTLRVLRSVARGQGAFHLQLATGSSASLVELFAPPVESDKLSDEESALLNLVSLGLTDYEIGQQMYLSPHTVKHRIERLRARLHVRNRIQLAAWAGRREALRDDEGYANRRPAAQGAVRADPGRPVP
jgi:DNA-binding NarL/FixJ family response regulator